MKKPRKSKALNRPGVTSVTDHSPLQSHLSKVGSVYRLRRVVPEELRPFFLTKTGKPRTEFMESLGTKDRREAEERCRLRLVQIDQLFREARDKLSGKQDRSAAREAKEFANFELSLSDSDARADELLAYEERESLRAALRTKLRASVGKKNPAEIEVLLDMVDQRELASEPERQARQRKVETAWNAGAERAAKLFEQGLLGKKPQRDADTPGLIWRTGGLPGQHSSSVMSQGAPQA